MFEAFVTLLFTSPLPVALVLIGIGCVVLSIIGTIPPIPLSKDATQKLGKLGGILIFLAVVSSLLLAFVTRPIPNVVLPTLNPTTVSVSTPTSDVPTAPTRLTTTEIPIGQIDEMGECLSSDFVPQLTGIHPPTETLICIPSSTIAWISSDAAQFSIPSIDYDRTFNVGFTFVLYGPIKFSISGVQSRYVRLDLRTDASLISNFDGKTLNLIFKEGKVCDYALYTGSACP